MTSIPKPEQVLRNETETKDAAYEVRTGRRSSSKQHGFNQCLWLAAISQLFSPFVGNLGTWWDFLFPLGCIEFLLQWISHNIGLANLPYDNWLLSEPALNNKERGDPAFTSRVSSKAVTTHLASLCYASTYQRTREYFHMFVALMHGEVVL